MQMERSTQQFIPQAILQYTSLWRRTFVPKWNRRARDLSRHRCSVLFATIGSLNAWSSHFLWLLPDVHWKTKKKKTRFPSQYRHRRLRSTRKAALKGNHQRKCKLNCQAFHASHQSQRQMREKMHRAIRQRRLPSQWHRWKHKRPASDTVLPCAYHAAHAMTSRDSAIKPKAVFDADSSQLLVDNCASSSITNSLADFVKPPRHSNKCIQGINGIVTALQIGTVEWDILDDTGKRHTLRLPGTYFVPNSPHRLLSPQHWAQTAKDDTPLPNGTWCATYQDCIVSCCSITSKPTLLAMPSTIDLTDPEDIKIAQPTQEETNPFAEEPEIPKQTFRQPTNWEIEITSEDTQYPDHPKFDDPATELLHWHYRMGHLPFTRLKQMARMGILPARLADAQISVCSSKRRYLVATIFVDHYSSMDYPVLQQSNTSKETVEAKEQFELHASTFGVTIRHYHADNGRFADNLFRESVARCNQTLSFSGVGIHSQNGKAEKRIQDLQNATRTMLLHAERQWPNAINTHLWPYALRMASDVYNHSPREGKEAAPAELFTGMKMRPLVDKFHHFGCPTDVLLSDLQSGKKGRKWNNRARVGIYLGRSMHHAKSISLILSLDTGLVSPQFHCSFDDMFETTRADQVHLMPRSQWQERGHFITTSTKGAGAPRMEAANSPARFESVPDESEGDDIRTDEGILDDYHVAFESIAVT
mmetsp:Transcript_21887/g.31387  ORF Transcript_21887/g.31387 Transcript_21887/m.31387 type:complete len:702 (-) Transcript_21887:158-2263(-)